MSDDVTVDREAAEAALRVIEQFPLLRDAHVAGALRSAITDATDRRRLVDLLASFGVAPDIEESPEATTVDLSVDRGNVEGYGGFYCRFTFDPQTGAFRDVGVWE